VLLGDPDPDEAVALLRFGPAEDAPAPTGNVSASDDLDLMAAMPGIEETPGLPEVDIFVYSEKETPNVQETPVGDFPIEPPSRDVADPDPTINREEDDAVMLEVAEIDLSTALAGLLSAQVLPPVLQPRPAPPAPPEVPPAVAPTAEVPVVDEPAPDIEDVFAQMRAKTAREQQASAALGQYERALQFIEQGLDLSKPHHVLRSAQALLHGQARADWWRPWQRAIMAPVLVSRRPTAKEIS